MVCEKWVETNEDQTMKTYTVDFESFTVEAKTYDEAKEKASKQAWEDHGMKLDDELLQDEDQKPNRWTAVYNSFYVEASDEDIAWSKAIKFANQHNLDIIEMDEGYET